MTNKLTVEQCDRDAAAHFIGIIFDEICGQETRDGKDDSDELVQAFARHRQQAEARAEVLERALEGIANMTQPKLAKEETSFEMRDAAIAALAAYRSARP